MAAPEPRNIDWGTSEVEEGTLTVELTGASSKPWKHRFESVLALLETPHSGWGDARVTRKSIHVADVGQGTETELRHFLEEHRAAGQLRAAPARGAHTRRRGQD